MQRVRISKSIEVCFSFACCLAFPGEIKMSPRKVLPDSGLVSLDSNDKTSVVLSIPKYSLFKNHILFLDSKTIDSS